MSEWHPLIKNDPRYKAARLEAFERDGWACVDCGRTDRLHADHDPVPLAVLFAGGVTDELIAEACSPDALVTRCESCNTRKGAKASTKKRVTWIHPEYQDVLDMIDAASDKAVVL